MNKRKIRFNRLSKMKRMFLSAMKWNLKAKDNPLMSKTKPTVTCGAFGNCKMEESFNWREFLPKGQKTWKPIKSKIN